MVVFKRLFTGIDSIAARCIAKVPNELGRYARDGDDSTGKCIKKVLAGNELICSSKPRRVILGQFDRVLSKMLAKPWMVDCDFALATDNEAVIRVDLAEEDTKEIFSLLRFKRLSADRQCGFAILLCL